MYGKTRSTKVQKQNKKSVGKRGFTLVELSVVMALVAILATMTVSFTVLMSGFANDSRAEYEYLEEYSNLKEALSNWLQENDIDGATFNAFTVESNGFYVNKIEKHVHFENDTLYLGNETKSFDSIDSVTFAAIDGKLIKCTTTRKNSEQTMSFVFYPRFATITGGSGE